MQPEAPGNIEGVMIAAGLKNTVSLGALPWRQSWFCVAAGGIALGLLTVWLLALGRPMLCPCGSVRLWAPAQDSQQLADWYSLLHVTFGLGLFALVRRFQPRWPLSLVALAALLGSVAWEAIENLPGVIALFSLPGGGQTYVGDTVLNAYGDTLAVIAGCWLGARTSTRAAVAAAVLIEIAVWLAIRDGLLVGAARLLQDGGLLRPSP